MSLTRSFALAWLPLILIGPLSADEASISFNRDIRPILAEKCFACHGFDAKKREGDLRLDIAEAALQPRDGGPAIKPGDPAESQVWQRINSEDPNAVMPPPDSNKSLTPQQKETLRRWIEQGAPYQKHWAFESIQRPAVPAEIGAVVAGGTVRTPIDAFILQRLAEAGLAAAPETDRETLIRRVSFSLTGLPPTLADIKTFLDDQSPDAYEKMVDRYLHSSHFGEEMARHWLDVARYADTHGLHLDNERQMWAYRDYVIQAFNANKRFDQFTVEQLAGDLLPQPTQEQLIATGYNRCNVTTSEGGSINDELLFRYAVDRASTTVETWMGLTGGCAVCHDHKFDPLSSKEFYQLYAFFYSNADPAMDGNALLTNPVLKLMNPEQQQQLAELDGRLAATQKKLDDLAATIAYNDPAKVVPRPPVEVVESVWMEDEFPVGAKPQGSPGHPTNWVTADSSAPVYHGQRSLRRVDKGLAQDFFEGGASPLEIPGEATFFVYVHLDPLDTPKTLMIQFHKGGWLHRAVWGDYNAIDWGKPNTTERVLIGPLPETGKWVRLEVPAAKLGLQAGDQLTGFAVTQFGGTVHWDHLGVAGRSDPAADPRRSFLAWWKSRVGQDTPGVLPELNTLLKAGPDKAPPADQEKKLLSHYLQNVCLDTKAPFASVQGELATLRQQRESLDNSIPSTFIFKELDKPRDAFVMQRGAYDKPGEKVDPNVPSIFPALTKLSPDARATRLDLARWLVSPEHPLTARVTVNRFWQQFFGLGLVKTSGDFGSQGEPPSHPELLDWLASHFRDSGWDVKGLVGLMMKSSTFRQSSGLTPALLARDPENRLLARAPRLRLDAEQIRDNALFVSGLIQLEQGGSGVKPYQPANIWEPVGFAGSNTRFYKQDAGKALYRRSVYTFLKRTAPPPFMANFDAPNREQFCTRRERSNTPLQALQLMNDVQHVEAARALAQRMLMEGGTTDAERIIFAFRTVLARQPETVEQDILRQQLAAHLARYAHDEAAAKQLIATGESRPNADLKPTDLAAYTLVANTILNLDETITRN